MTAIPPNPSHILQIGTGFLASRTLFAAVELDVFTKLSEGPATGRELAARCGLHERAYLDFFDALLALGFLRREGEREDAVYSNTADSAVFLDRKSPQFLGGLVTMMDRRMYPMWADLPEALRTGQPQNEIKSTGMAFFEALYADQARLEEFLGGMAGSQMGNFIVLAERFDFWKYPTILDVGGASGAFSIHVARRHPTVRCTTFDLPPVEPVARRNVAAAGLEERVTVAAGDFFRDPLPRADVITMGNILHDWSLAGKQALIRKAYESLPEGGVFIAIENLIDDDRRHNALGLMMSLTMLLETMEGFDYTGAQFDQWCRAAGFRSTEIVPLTGPASAAIAYK